MESAHKFTDMVKEFQISSLIELLDSFGESTLYKLPTATKAWCIQRDNDCRTTDSEQYNFFQNSNLRWCNKNGIGSVWQKYCNEHNNVDRRGGENF